jgi:monoamine oxidase
MLWCTMRNIAVIGGGVAGLAAARELARAGQNVILLEARGRLGGRIFTRLADRTPIELGAEFIHGGNREFWKQIGAAHLKTLPVSGRFRTFENGAFRSRNLEREIRTVLDRIDPGSGDEPFARFLSRHAFPDSTRCLVTSFVEGFEAADPRKIGTRALAASNRGEAGPGPRQFRLQRGYSALVHFLEQQARQLGARIWTNTVVESVHWNAGAVRIGARRNRRRLFRDADAAVITLPLGVLKAGSVKFLPSLPQEKQAAIHRLQFGNAVRIVLCFRRPFWPERNFGFVVAVGDRIPTWWSDSRGPVLIGWAGGPRADALSGQSAAQLKMEAVRILAKIFNTNAAFIRKELRAFNFHSWARDEFAAGAYSYIPVNGLTLPQQLAAPIERTLFFAGEATAAGAEWGTVHAALSSGVRAAREIRAG